jgi:hypothetical protein
MVGTARAGTSIEERLGELAWVLEVGRPGEGRALVAVLHQVSEQLRATLPSGRSKGSVRATGALSSPAWSAPELLQGAAPDARSDVWAFGLVAFRLMTGRAFWASAPGDYAGLAIEVSSAPIPVGSARDPRFPRELDAWLARCVSRDPAQRFVHVGAAFGELLVRVPLRPRAPVHPAVSARPAPERAFDARPLLVGLAALSVPAAAVVLILGVALGLGMGGRRSPAAPAPAPMAPIELAQPAPPPPPAWGPPMQPLPTRRVEAPWSPRRSSEVLDPWDADRFAHAAR